MIEVRGLVKRYGRFTAVDGLSFEVAAGRVLALLGPNGAGKSTTIRAVTGQVLPTAGTVTVGGHDVTRRPLEAKALIGYVPDRPYLYPNLTGRELLRFLGRLRRVEGAEERARELLERFELTRAADELVQTYSHGMRQRLTFCAALLHRPRALVIDEPMVGLDPKSARILKNLLTDFCAQGGTVFLSTHLLSVAEELADRIGIITRGKMRFLGTKEELSNNLSRQGTLEELFLELTEGAEDAQVNPFGGPRAELA